MEILLVIRIISFLFESIYSMINSEKRWQNITEYSKLIKSKDVALKKSGFSLPKVYDQ